MRLFISNSKSRVFILLIGVVLLQLFLVECFYTQMDIPCFVGETHDVLLAQAKSSSDSTLFIIGDSRAEAGIVPRIIDSALNTTVYNIGFEGIYNGFYNGIVKNDNSNFSLIVAVSPYSVFNSYKHTKSSHLKERFSKISFLFYLNNYTELFFTRLLDRKTHLSYGLYDVLDIFNHDMVSTYYTELGWHAYDRLGADELYTTMINTAGYRHTIIEQYKDSAAINYGKNNFDEFLNYLHQHQIKATFHRLPTSEEIRNIEDSKYPWFSSYIKKSTKHYGFDYTEYTCDNYPLSKVDGSHLNIKGAKEFTYELLDNIYEH